MKRTTAEVQQFYRELDEQKDDAFTRLLADVRAGGTETLKQWCAFMGHFHQYSWGNVMMAYAQKPDMTLLASFDDWKAVGRHVRKDEHGLKIFVPMKRFRTKIEVNDDGIEQEVQVPVTRFKIGNVFDVSQTDGDPLPEHPLKASGDATRLVPALETAMQASGVILSTVEFILGHASALGVSRRDHRIEVRADLDLPMRASVLVHEWAHEQLHWTGQKRNVQTEECDAELVAYMVSDHFGLQTSAADYLVQHGVSDTLLAHRLPVVWETARTIIQAVYAAASTETVAVAA